MATVLQSDRIAEKPLLLISINLFYFDAKKCAYRTLKCCGQKELQGVFRNKLQIIFFGAKVCDSRRVLFIYEKFNKMLL